MASVESGATGAEENGAPTEPSNDLADNFPNGLPNDLAEREQIISAADGWQLNVVDLSRPNPVATVIVGHAMMVDRRTMWRKNRLCIASTFVDAGLRVLVPDQRGHGRSGPTPAEGGDWSYRDLVDDTAAYVDLARRLEPELPVALVGHSLFGHTSLAYLGLHPEVEVAALVALAVNIWGRAWDPTRGRWLRKYATIVAATGFAKLWGYLPARRFGLGSADEAATYWRDLAGFVFHDKWGVPGEEGVDYHAGLAHVRCPVLHVVSDGDRLAGNAEDALNFTSTLPHREVLRLGPECEVEALRSLMPDHMPLVTSPRSVPIWREVAAWLTRRLVGPDR